MEFGQRWTDTMLQGTPVHPSCKLRQPLTVSVIDHQGAYAGVYVTTSWGEGERAVTHTVRMPPALEEADVGLSTYHVVRRLIDDYVGLHAHADDLKGDDKKRHDSLGGLLEAA